jgi:hypothetical protein
MAKQVTLAVIFFLIVNSQVKFLICQSFCVMLIGI